MREESDERLMREAMEQFSDMPDGDARDRRIMAAFRRAQRDRELQRLGLPELSDARRLELWDECLLEVLQEDGRSVDCIPADECVRLTDLALAKWDLLVLSERERVASANVRRRLIARRLDRRWFGTTDRDVVGLG